VDIGDKTSPSRRTEHLETNTNFETGTPFNNQQERIQRPLNFSDIFNHNTLAENVRIDSRR